MGDLALHLGNEILLGLLHGKAGDALQHLGLAALDEVDFLLGLVGGGVLGCQKFFFLLDVFGLSVQVFFLLLQTALLLLQVRPAALLFLLVLGAGLQDLLFCLQQCFSLFALGALDGLVDDPAGLLLRAGDFFFRYFLPIGNAEKEGNGRHNDRDHQGDQGLLPCEHVTNFLLSFLFAVGTLYGMGVCAGLERSLPAWK